MRFLFKTDYDDDIKLFPHRGYVISYGLLLAALIVAPFVLSSYLVSQLVFVCIYATVGVGLMILTGFTGQASLGHAAFLAIGAYTTAYLHRLGVPFPVYFLAAGLLAGVIGALVGFPALRLQGIYLVIATIAFALIVEEIADTIVELKKRGLSILLSEQNVGFARIVSDRAYMLEKGQICWTGTMAELADNTDIQRAYLTL